jgi:CMP-N,N'-diacetyllegionaminic acid synthase
MQSISNRKIVLVVIPARGGSKGIPKKNLSMLHGKTLTEWAMLSALQIKSEKRIVLSSDSEEILDLSSKYHGVIPSKRPHELSKDFVADYRVLQYELAKAESKESIAFDCIVMLQPTSPIRNPETLESCINSVLNGKTAAWTVSEVPIKFHPRKQLAVKNQKLCLAVDSPLVVARQELSQTYIRTGVCYAISRDTVVRDETLMGTNAMAVFCNWPSVNIDEQADLIRAQEISLPNKGLLFPRGVTS